MLLKQQYLKVQQECSPPHQHSYIYERTQIRRLPSTVDLGVTFSLLAVMNVEGSASRLPSQTWGQKSWKKPAFFLSSFLTSFFHHLYFLTPLSTKHESYVWDTQDFLERVQALMVPGILLPLYYGCGQLVYEHWHPSGSGGWAASPSQVPGRREAGHTSDPSAGALPDEEWLWVPGQILPAAKRHCYGEAVHSGLCQHLHGRMGTRGSGQLCGQPLIYLRYLDDIWKGDRTWGRTYMHLCRL